MAHWQTFRTVPIFLAFLVMGFADAVGPFVGLAKNEFQLSTAVAAVIPLLGLGMFGFLSIPTGIFQDRYGKKTVLVLGLTVAFVGLVNASFGLATFSRLLVTVLFLGAGAAILQVAGNPIMRDVSAPGRYARNLALGQFIKALGSLSGPLIPALAARYFSASWKVIFPIYAVATLLTLLAVLPLRVEEKEPEHPPATFRSCFALLRHPYVTAMVGGIFLYVGAEVCVSAATPLYLQQRFQVDLTRVGLLGTGLFFTALTIGRLSGGILLHWMRPERFFLITSVVSAIALLGMFTGSAPVAIAALFVAGLGFANIFPLIFAIAVEQMPQYTNALSGLMVTAIVGGAVLPPIMGLLADRSSMETSFLVPLAAIVYVTALAFRNWRHAR